MIDLEPFLHNGVGIVLCFCLIRALMLLEGFMARQRAESARRLRAIDVKIEQLEEEKRTWRILGDTVGDPERTLRGWAATMLAKAMTLDKREDPDDPN